MPHARACNALLPQLAGEAERGVAHVGPELDCDTDVGAQGSERCKELSCPEATSQIRKQTNHTTLPLAEWHGTATDRL